MKKKISFLFMIALLALSLIMPCVADEPTTDLVTEITTELVTEVLEETPAETTPEETSAVEETTPVVTEPEVPAETEPEATTEDAWEMFKAKITDSATWTMLGTGLLTILTIVGTVKSKFDKISSLVHSKADEDTIKGELKDVKDDLKKEYDANHKEITAFMERCEAALKNTEENEHRLYAILTLFMTNCKISESAKAEILNILADVKKYSGDIGEVVAQAQEAIDKDIADNQKNALPTPTLDQMLEEDYMELG
jgi:gas vesicle protein